VITTCIIVIIADGTPIYVADLVAALYGTVHVRRASSHNAIDCPASQL
jgi:hypothetical protein